MACAIPQVGALESPIARGKIPCQACRLRPSIIPGRRVRFPDVGSCVSPAPLVQLPAAPAQADRTSLASGGAEFPPVDPRHPRNQRDNDRGVTPILHLNHDPQPEEFDKVANEWKGTAEFAKLVMAQGSELGKAVFGALERLIELVGKADPHQGTTDRI